MGLRIVGVPAPATTGATPTPTTPTRQSYRHVQPTPTTLWRFTHDLPFHPAGVRITDYDAPAVEWDVLDDYDPTTKTYTLTFPHPVRGEVTVS